MKPETFNLRQKRGRDAEWETIKPFIEDLSPGLFLDVGCGTGYATAEARRLGFRVVGVDPESKSGVRDESVNSVKKFLLPAVAEQLPFADNTFDVVYSSHAIEHFSQIETGVAELARVLKTGGRAVLMIPTGTMAAIRMPSLWLFYTHRSIARFLLRNRTLNGFSEIFLGPPHGSEARYAVQEINVFGEKRWRELIGHYFEIETELRPCLYPWPDYPQVFPLMRLKHFSTSIVLICAKRS